ncbi:MAG: rod shape-determining protein MreC [Acidobacteria bacterium]|nr:rod shape-determining protein MreC [Acidobacteriota bacterium]
MSGLLTERRPVLLLMGLLAFNLILMSSRVRSDGEGSLLARGILVMASPFLKASAAVGRSTANTWRAYIHLIGVEEINQILRSDLDGLRARVHDLEEMRNEVERLRSLLDLQDRLDMDSTAARIIARGSGHGVRTLLLNRGERHGVRMSDPVVTLRGLVGRVVEVGPAISKVQTLSDPNSGVAALIQRTRVQGLVVGEGESGCRMEYVMELSDVEVGDVIITSGLDRIYPKGQMIGVVTDLGEGEGLTRFVGVRPEVDLLRVEEVLVLHPAARNGGDASW